MSTFNLTLSPFNFNLDIAPSSTVAPAIPIVPVVTPSFAVNIVIPLAISTADNTVITADTIDFTADGACLINGGASDIERTGPSVTVSQPLFVPLYGPSFGGKTPLPVMYPPQTYVINGVPRRSGQ